MKRVHFKNVLIKQEQVCMASVDLVLKVLVMVFVPNQECKTLTKV